MVGPTGPTLRMPRDHTRTERFSTPMTNAGQQVQIERRHGLTSEDIYRDHLSGTGLPVILTDSIQDWRARSLWSTGFFKERYGSETVVPSLGTYGGSRRVMKLSDFIHYIEAPSRGPRGF